MTIMVWVRHTEHERGSHVLTGRLSGIGLSDRGRADARALADRLASLPIRAIYHSPLQRTLETCQPLASRLGLEPRMLPEIDEVEFGEWTGRAFAELEAMPQWQRWTAMRGQVRPPGGEMMLEVQARIASAVERLRVEHGEEMIALFSHGDVIRAAMALMLGVHIDLFLRIEIGLGSVSAVRVAERRVQVMCVNAMSRESGLGV